LLLFLFLLTLKNQIAIVIPYFKIDFFESTLNSLLAQTDQRFTVYIGDDASDDHPDHLLVKYRNQLNLIYHRFENNLGGISLTKQWERCIQLTQDEPWIMVLGDDDVLEETVIESFYEHKHKAKQLIRLATMVIDENGDELSGKYTHPEEESFWCFLERRISQGSRSSLSEYIFQKMVFEKYGFKDFPLAWHSDDWAWLEFSENQNIYSINSTTVYIRVSPRSISGSKLLDEKKRKATQEYVKCIIKRYNAGAQLFVKLLNNYEHYFFQPGSFKHFILLGRAYYTKGTLWSWFKYMFRCIRYVFTIFAIKHHGHEQ